MWLITPAGFFSVVQKPDDVRQGTLTLRSRVRRDLELLAPNIAGMGPIKEHAGTDYPFRAQAPRESVALAFADMLRSIDYDNFKDRVALTQGKARAQTYAQVWHALHGLAKSAGATTATPRAPDRNSGKPKAYGGVLVDDNGLVLLRSPKDHFDGYVWTFPKGRVDQGES